MPKIPSIACLLLSPGLAQAQEEPLAPVVTSHRVAIAGQVIAYTAEFAQKVLRDAQGRPQATISATAYLRDRPGRGHAGDDAHRPVIFAFNGGPGASSSPLQFEGIGPRLRLKAADGTQSIAENPDSLIDKADLVFIDPVGTGLNRVLPGGSGKPFWSVPGDAVAVLGLIRAWVRSHHRARSPLILVGESYGGTRLARICADAADLNLTGLVLISPSFDSDPLGANPPASDAKAVALLPAMAIAAAQNGKGETGQPLARVFAQARAFAAGGYSAALARGAALPLIERQAVAARVAALTGLSMEEVLRAGLRPDPEAFRKRLRRSEGLVVGLLDTRVTAPVPAAALARPSAANDPALGLGATNVILSDGITRYMHGELAVPGTQPYVSLSLDINFQWDWALSRHDPASRDPAADIARIMRAKPRLMATVIGGYFDMAVPVLAPRRALVQAGVPMRRVRSIWLWQGHSVFASASARKRARQIFAPLLAITG